jgi:hypothetical protein
VAAGAIVAGRATAATLPADVATPLALATHLYALVLLAALLLVATALGRSVVRRCGVEGQSRLEHDLFAVAVGLGLVASVVVGLGLAQVLDTGTLGAAVVLLAVLARRDLLAVIQGVPTMARSAWTVRRSLRAESRWLALLVPMVEILVVALLLHALAPPTANDTLTYHLQAPRRFLQLGGLAPLSDVQQANMPLAVNMLYLLGLAFGSDELGGVLHLAIALLVAAATFSLGRRLFGQRVGWIAATTFVSTQMMLVFGTVAYVDYGLALFDFLAVYAFVLWRESGRRGWLIAAGLLVGCALASKYLGVLTAVCLGVWLLGAVVRERRQLGIVGAVRSLLAFGLPALLLAGPWYLKNLVWFGNPVWPFLAANPNDFNMYLGGTTRFEGSSGLVGALLLPARLYLNGSVEYPVIRPPLQLLVLPLYLLLPKHRTVTALLCLAGVHFVAWSQGAHILRYYLQVLPELSIAAAYVIGRLISAPPGVAMVRPLVNGLVVVGLAFPTIISLGAVMFVWQVPQLVGLESRQAYLDRMVQNSRLVTYLNGDHERVSRVLLIGDNRGFYLDRPMWADVSMEVFQSLVDAPDGQAARARLRELGISHVMVNMRDLAWYTPFDPEQRASGWARRFEASRAGYLEVVGSHEESTLYRVLP